MVYRYYPYYYDEHLGKFMPITLHYACTCIAIHEDLSKGVRSQADWSDAYKLHGPCMINVPYYGVIVLVGNETLSPLNFFQATGGSFIL